jgi:LPS-assembly lipoprotein
MWWPEPKRLIPFAAALALAGLTAGCFQPEYGDHSFTAAGGAPLTARLAGVEVAPIDVPNGTRLARVSEVVRNKLMVKLASKQLQVIVDVNTGRPDVQNYGIDVTYQLIDLKTGKPVVSGQTFARVSYDIPGQEQRFAGERGLRNAEDRAAKTIAENIHSRLASYFVAGT